jgi:hypothetical protein
MDTEPMLPTHLLDSLSEYSKVSHFSAPLASPASFYKEHIIFGTHPSPLPHGTHLRRGSIDGRHDLDLPSCEHACPFNIGGAGGQQGPWPPLTFPKSLSIYVYLCVKKIKIQVTAASQQ